MNASSAEPPIGKKMPLTKHLLLEIVDGYRPDGIIYEKWIENSSRFGYPVKTIPGADDTIRSNSPSLIIPFGEGKYPVGDRNNNLIFEGDDENGTIYLNRKEPDYQLFFYEPPIGTDFVGRVERRKQAKFDSLWDGYLQKRDEIRDTQQAFDAYVMVRDIISSARRVLRTGEPMDYTINGFRDQLESQESEPSERERERERKTSLGIDIGRSLSDITNDRQNLIVSGPLYPPRGGRRTRRSNKFNKRKTHKRKTHKRKISKRKSRKSKK